MFTARATMAAAPATTQGTAVTDNSLRSERLSAADVPRLLNGMNALLNSERLTEQQVIVTSDIPATLGTVESGWNAIAVPILLITAQLLVPVWLLLFLAVRDAARRAARRSRSPSCVGTAPGAASCSGCPSRSCCSAWRCRPGC